MSSLKHKSLYKIQFLKDFQALEAAAVNKWCFKTQLSSVVQNPSMDTVS